MTVSNRDIVVVGPITVEDHIWPQQTQDSRTMVCQAQSSLGGFSWQAAQALSAVQECRLRPIFLLGQSVLADTFKEQAGDHFPHARSVSYDHPMPRSIIIDHDKVYQTRLEVPTDALPPDVIESLRSAGAVVVGPASLEERGVTLRVLANSPRSFLLLSDELVSQTPAAIELMAAAGECVLDRQQAIALTGKRNPIEAMLELHRLTGSNIFVADDKAIHARYDGNWYRQPCFIPEQITKTTGNREVFIANLAAALATGETIEDALMLAAAASGRYQEGLPLADLMAIQIWANRRDLHKRHRRQQFPFSPAAMAASIALTLLVSATAALSFRWLA